MTKEEFEKAQQTCEEYLGNADISHIELKDDSILLKFATGDENNFIEISIECLQIGQFLMTKHWSYPISEGFFVGETQLKFLGKPEQVKIAFDATEMFLGSNQFPEHCYILEIDGGITIKIICVEIKLDFERREENKL